MTSVPNVSLPAGTTTIDIPQLGFGVWQVPDDRGEAAVATALEVGYRHIDTAAALRQRGRRRPGPRRHRRPPRRGLRHDQGLERRARAASHLRAFDALDGRLGLDVARPLPHPLAAPRPRTATSRPGRRCASCATPGRVRAIGVCNFHRRTCSGCSTRPGSGRRINQVELHPCLQQRRAARVRTPQHGIVTEAWSPLASGGSCSTTRSSAGSPQRPRRDPGPGRPRAGTSRWGIVVMPKSVTPSRIAENFAVVRLRARPRTTSPRSPHSTAASAPAPTRTTSTRPDPAAPRAPHGGGHQVRVHPAGRPMRCLLTRRTRS